MYFKQKYIPFKQILKKLKNFYIILLLEIKKIHIVSEY